MAAARIEVRLVPRASRDELRGVREGVLHARVCAAPVDGEANRALCRLIADATGVARSRVSIARGDRARLKLVAVEGVLQEELLAALRAGF